MANPEHDPAFSATMREMSRAAIADIWRRGQSGDVLGAEDAAFYKSMLDHPEYIDFWERAAELGGREIDAGGVNPFLHVSLHSVIERQIADRNPPETEQAVFRLARAGVDRHDALHLVASVLTELMAEMLNQRRPFSIDTYRRRLRLLKA